MRPPGILYLGWLGVLAGSLLGLFLLQPEEARSVDAFPGAPTAEDVVLAKRLDPVDLSTHWRVTYQYEDFAKSKHLLYCDIDKEAHRRETSAFGLLKEAEDRWRELDGLLRKEVVKKAGKLSHYCQIRISHKPGEKWDWEIAPRNWNLEGAPELKDAANEFERWISSQLKEEALALADRYYRQRGFLLNGEDKLDIDYRGLSSRAKASLEDCYQALRREAAPRDASELLSFMLAFFQDLEFQSPPENENGLQKAGFWTPLDVMSRRAGDCDSKATGLCSLWRGYPTQILAIDEEVSPADFQGANRHLLLAFEGEPVFGQAYIEIGLRKFVLGEVAGPAKLSPGMRVRSGEFRRFLCLTDDCPGTSTGWSQFNHPGRSKG